MRKRRKLTLITSVVLLLTSMLTLPTFAAVPTTGVSYINFANTEVFEDAEGFIDENNRVRTYLSDDKTEIHFYGTGMIETGFEIEFPNIKLKDLFPNIQENQNYTTIFKCNMEARIIFEFNNIKIADYDAYQQPEYFSYNYFTGEESLKIIVMPYDMGIEIEQQFTLSYFLTTQNTDGNIICNSFPEIWTPYEPAYFETSKPYDEGYAEGYLQAQKDHKNPASGVFEYASFNAAVIYNLGDGQQVKNIAFTPNKTYGGVSFDKVKSLIYAWSEEEFGDNLFIMDFIDNVHIELSWDEEHVFDYLAFPLYLTGSALVEYGNIRTTDNKTYVIQADQESSSTKKKMEIQNCNENIALVNYLYIQVGRPEDLLNEFTLYSESKEYSNGYTDGYTMGFKDGADNDVAYNKGYKLGFSYGKEEGLKIAESGEWKKLLTAVVEVPVNTFQSLFNFEILGLDMRLAFGSILALCVLIIILKKTVL